MDKVIVGTLTNDSSENKTKTITGGNALMYYNFIGYLDGFTAIRC